MVEVVAKVKPPEPEPTDQVQHAWKVHGSNVKGQDMVPIWRTEGDCLSGGQPAAANRADVSREELKGFVEEDYRSSGYAAAAREV